MGIIELFLISIGLGMDVFAVSICKGIPMAKMSWKKAIIIALYFMIFHVIMTVIGYFLGIEFETIITNLDHWIAFILLALIGGKMIKDSFNKDSEEHDEDISFKSMTFLAIGTSIDALAIGISFAFLNVNIILASIIIAIVTLILSLLGTKIGNVFGSKYKNKAVLLGGIILILIGIKILLEHLNVLPF